MSEEMKKRGNKTASIHDVAKLAGVSTGTVSHALNSIGYVKNETRERVIAAAKALNYIPNRAGRILKTNQTKLIMLAIPDTSNEIYFGMIEGILQIIKPAGYSLLLYYTNALEHEELHAIRLLQERVIDGLILVHFSYSKELLDEVNNTSAPIVLLGMCNHLWTEENQHFDTVSIDVYSGIFEEVSHLVKMGHRKIGYLAGRQGIEVYHQRYQAYLDALQSCGIEARDEYVQWGDYTKIGGYSAGRQLYQLSDRPTAICASNDLQCIGCWEAIRDLGGKVPETMALTGMDNLSISQILGISSMNMREGEMGTEAAKLLLTHLVDGSDLHQNLYFKPELQVRDSSLLVQ